MQKKLPNTVTGARLNQEPGAVLQAVSLIATS